MNLATLLDMAQSGYGERCAIGRRGTGITFSRLAEIAAGGAELMRSMHAGQAVLLARNGPVMPHLMFAAALAGVPFTPLNYRLGASQINELIAELDSPVIVADPDYLDVVGHGFLAVSSAQFFAESLRLGPGAAGDPAEVSTRDDDPAVLLFTSGTTARPKIVPIRHENLVSYVLQTVDFGSAEESEAALVTMPPYHIAAVASVLSNLYAARRVVYLPDFEPREWLRLAREERISAAMVVPTMLARVVDSLAGQSSGTPTLRTISYGGARMPEAVLEKALRAFPDVGFVNAYGLTETSSTIAVLGPEDHRAALAADDPALRARLSSVGRPIPGIEVQVRAADGTVLGPGLTGELWVRGPQVSGEYVGTGSVLDGEGWFPTGDLAHVDDDGFVFIHGRADDTIIRGGENIAPAEVEDVLLHHPAVAQVGVVGIPDDEWGQRLVAAVVPRPGHTATADELKSYVRSRLRSSRTPDAIVWRDELPHTATGKLLRHDLAASLAGPGSSRLNDDE